MISVIDFLETKLPPHTWYSADVDAIGQAVRKYNLQSGIIKKIGTASSLKKICAEIDQFLSGIFFAVQNDQQYESIDVEVDTEDKPFRTLNIEGVFLEIRAFDTSFFDFFSENEKILKELSEKFKGNAKQDNKYTWNDRVSIRKEAPLKYHPGKIGIICGMSKIAFEEIAKKYNCELGSWIYTVEFEDGSYIHIIENYLERCHRGKSGQK
jgi:hypothetical protein